jgi:transcriptional regulator with XRE-family HTH domain
MIREPTIDTFGDLLKHWRQVRRLSQMELALTANVSTRHLSFIETGRAQPGYDLILRLADVLDLPLRQTNALLVAAGYAPRYTVWSIDDDQTGMVRAALERMLAQHEPYPALVTRRNYDLIMTNTGARRLIMWLTDGDDLLARFGNSYRLLFAADGLRPYVVNFDLLQGILLKRLHAESINYQSAALFQVYEACAADVADRNLGEPPGVDSQLPVIPLGLRKGNVDVWFFSTVTTFGTAIDVTTQELRIENLFPANEHTQRVMRELSNAAHEGMENPV